jgi:polysaccharide export outer membrane protein
MLRSLAILSLTCALAACGGRQPLGQNADVRVLPAHELPLPAHNNGTASGDYIVQPTDTLAIDVPGLDGLTDRKVFVDHSGHISLPIAGRVAAAGRTPAQIEELLAQRLRAAFVRDPKPSVNVNEAASQVVTVSGQVLESGIYPVFPEMTLTRAVASAKGVSEFAKMDDVVVLRTVNGQRYAAIYNLGAIQRGNYVDPPIVANDVIIVGDSSSRRLIKNLVTIVPSLTTPLVVLLQ